MNSLDRYDLPKHVPYNLILHSLHSCEVQNRCSPSSKCLPILINKHANAKVEGHLSFLEPAPEYDGGEYSPVGAEHVEPNGCDSE